MKYSLFFLLSIILYMTNLYAQNPYQINTSSTDRKEPITDPWVQPIRYNTLRPGLRFMVLPETKGSAYALAFKSRDNPKELLVKDFGAKTFVYKRQEDAKKWTDSPKRLYFFECEGKEYFLEENKPENANKIINWDEPSIVWLDEIDVIRNKLKGKTVWMNANSWNYEINGETATLYRPEKFAKISILDVGIGSYSNYPIRILFKNDKDQKKYYIDGCASGTLNPNFSHDNLHKMILLADPRSSNTGINSVRWSTIEKRQVVKGMTEEECYLSLGKPNERSTTTKKNEQYITLGYKPTDQTPYYLAITLKNNKVIEINKSE